MKVMKDLVLVNYRNKVIIPILFLTRYMIADQLLPLFGDQFTHPCDGSESGVRGDSKVSEVPFS